SGWAGVVLLVGLATTPVSAVLHWSGLLDVRRMIGVTALLYTVAHIVVYFALRFWDFAHIAHEMATRLTLVVATISTIGLIALGATSVDAAVGRFGVEGWERLHATVYLLTGLALLHYLLSRATHP